MKNELASAKATLERHGYQIAEYAPTDSGGHLYVLDPVHCVAGKTLKWVEDRRVRIGSYGEACKFLDARS